MIKFILNNAESDKFYFHQKGTSQGGYNKTKAIEIKLREKHMTNSNCVCKNYFKKETRLELVLAKII